MHNNDVMSDKYVDLIVDLISELIYTLFPLSIPSVLLIIANYYRCVKSCNNNNNNNNL